MVVVVINAPYPSKIEPKKINYNHYRPLKRTVVCKCISSLPMCPNASSVSQFCAEEVHCIVKCLHLLILLVCGYVQMFLHISNGGRDENEMCWLDVDDGFAVVNAMRELGLRPSRMALEALLDGCAAMNDSEQAQRVLQEMDREGLHLNIFSMIRLSI